MELEDFVRDDQDGVEGYSMELEDSGPDHQDAADNRNKLTRW